MGQLQEVAAAAAPEPVDGVPAQERHQRDDLYQEKAGHVRQEAWQAQGGCQDVQGLS